MRIKHFVTILVLLALAMPASAAQADVVVSVCDETHLLAALAGGGTVTFSCSGTITLTAEISIAADTTIDGSGQAVTISGNNAVRVATVNSGITLNLDRLTVANGQGSGKGGGIYNHQGTVTVSNTTFSDNHVPYFAGGGGIYNQQGTVTVSNSTFSDNSADVGGGGIFNEQGTVTVSKSIFSGNSGDYGEGGGILNAGTLIVSNSTFFHNSAPCYDCSGGGGIDNRGTLTVSNSTFSHNSADFGAGGGILNSGTLTVSNSTLSDNFADYGGGIRNDPYDAVTVSNSTFSGNSTHQIGGGIDNLGTLNVSNSTFYGNSASEVGGGIYNDSTLNVSNSTFSGNSAVYGGGSIFNNAGTLTVSNSTVSGNDASYGGGGIKNYGMLTVSNSTFSGNSAVYGGGIYGHPYYGTVTLKNTIVANSPAGGNCSGTITDGGGNLSYPDTTCPGINADPLLGPLQNNDGPTETMALGPGSAAIDAGIDAICAADPVNNLDQRGIARPLGSHCDIGAVEQEPYPSLPSRMWLPTVHAQ